MACRSETVFVELGTSTPLEVLEVLEVLASPEVAEVLAVLEVLALPGHGPGAGRERRAWASLGEPRGVPSGRAALGGTL